MVKKMEFKKFVEEYQIDPMRMIETIVEADMPSVCLFKNTESQIIYVNKRFFLKHKMFQNDPTSVYGKTDFDLFPDSIEHAKQAFEDEQQVIKTGKAINLVETEGKDEMGRTIIAHTKKFPVYNHQNEIIGTFIMTEDMTNDVATLRENQAKNELLTKLNIELTQENSIDALSSLYNRRFIRAELDSLYNAYKTQDIPFSIILIDLDNFKRVNDEFGHATGDEVITYVGTVLLNIKRQLYPTMEPCRYGGDEFLVILPTYQREGAIAIAKDIKEAFDNQILSSGHFHESVKMSIGIASIRSEEDIHQLITRCDKRLYEAKKNGKHQICY